MASKSIVQEAKDIHLAIDLINYRCTSSNIEK